MHCFCCFNGIIYLPIIRFKTPRAVIETSRLKKKKFQLQTRSHGVLDINNQTFIASLVKSDKSSNVLVKVFLNKKYIFL